MLSRAAVLAVYAAEALLLAFALKMRISSAAQAAEGGSRGSSGRSRGFFPPLLAAGSTACCTNDVSSVLHQVLNNVLSAFHQRSSVSCLITPQSTIRAVYLSITFV